MQGLTTAKQCADVCKVAVSGGTAPYTYAVDVTLPTPEVVADGTYPVTFTITDSASQTATKTIAVTVTTPTRSGRRKKVVE